MITYMRCNDVSMEHIFQAFSLGFSDYSIRLTTDQDDFAARFLGPEGNTRNHSFLAMDENQPIGLILGGVRQFDGYKTMRCGTLCVAPAYRGQGISNKLLELHKQTAISAGCQQLWLEVIKDNHRAVKLYEKQGYQSRYTLKYYNGTLPSAPPAALSSSYIFKEVTFDDIAAFRKTLIDCHIHWQSDTPYYATSTQEAFLGIYEVNQTCLGMVSMSAQGKINFLWVDPKHRNQGLGYALLHRAAEIQKIEKVYICLSDNDSLEGFIQKIGLSKDPIEQYEMCMPLKVDHVVQ
ncbi:GNAT family N-acetyltransferase [Paenibacillus polymyxa]|uniref:GNAT family N-acetyltransferase n=1 Tax=Paenibacillus polymyxa TaxID=1406 RepID=UPI002AB33CC7|nr:GNAT family N-acetyltransferase [Paenibacillus polymyxa]MDY8022225.1 GNAT family N-acetyltransferase [Paenibacillus polymyxa]